MFFYGGFQASTPISKKVNKMWVPLLNSLKLFEVRPPKGHNDLLLPEVLSRNFPRSSNLCKKGLHFGHFAPSSLQVFHVKERLKFCYSPKKPANCGYTKVTNHVPKSWHFTVVESDLHYVHLKTTLSYRKSWSTFAIHKWSQNAIYNDSLAKLK